MEILARFPVRKGGEHVTNSAVPRVFALQIEMILSLHRAETLPLVVTVFRTSEGLIDARAERACFVHEDAVATAALNIPCAPDGKVYVCEACGADRAMVFAKFFEKHGDAVRARGETVN